MKLAKVFVLHKKSTYQIQAIEHKEARFLKLLEQRSEAVTRVNIAHEEHLDTIEKLKTELKKRNIDFTVLARADLRVPMITGVDMVISVGGDGTFLDVSHFVDDIPVMGLNSSKSSSFGHFCIASSANLEQIFDQIESDELSPIPLQRLDLNLNGYVLSEKVLNEILVGHSSPAATSRYFVSIGDRREEHKSSGLWIGTASGSTGSIRSAGGMVLPIYSDQIQYVEREPCQRPGETFQLIQGVLPGDTTIEILSQMRTGKIFVDGPHIEYEFVLGDRLTIKASKTALNAFVERNVNNIF